MFFKNSSHKESMSKIKEVPALATLLREIQVIKDDVESFAIVVFRPKLFSIKVSTIHVKYFKNFCLRNNNALSQCCF